MVFGGELPWHRDGVRLTAHQQRQFDHVVELIDVPLEKRPYYVPAPACRLSAPTDVVDPPCDRTPRPLQIRRPWECDPAAVVVPSR